MDKLSIRVDAEPEIVEELRLKKKTRLAEASQLSSGSSFRPHTIETAQIVTETAGQLLVCLKFCIYNQKWEKTHFRSEDACEITIKLPPKIHLSQLEHIREICEMFEYKTSAKILLSREYSSSILISARSIAGSSSDNTIRRILTIKVYYFCHS